MIDFFAGQTDYIFLFNDPDFFALPSRMQL